MNKGKILKDVLEILWVPFLAFDIFLFYDDSIMDLWYAASLWSVFFAAALLVYFHRQYRACARLRLGGVIEAAFVAFATMFYVVNFVLLGLFLYIADASNNLLI